MSLQISRNDFNTSLHQGGFSDFQKTKSYFLQKDQIKRVFFEQMKKEDQKSLAKRVWWFFTELVVVPFKITINFKKRLF